MTRKLTILYAFTLLFAAYPAFAEEAAGLETKQGQPAKMEKMQGMNPAGQETDKAVEEKKTPEAVLRKVTEEETGKEAACPITGEKFIISTETISASYKDASYYFCCPGCDKSFIANPEKYLKKKQAGRTRIYACPMGCARSDKPGKCPKCGMNMKEVKEAAAKKYACPMGCARSGKPGKCPKCGMAMTEMKGE
ncbi:MAG: heavy metal-binding domain-containing protein [Elusimicrobiota bacterium]|nr:heavy metal-binding domain-containing protein [Elusimicrobiota bacterium]